MLRNNEFVTQPKANRIRLLQTLRSVTTAYTKQAASYRAKMYVSNEILSLIGL